MNPQSKSCSRTQLLILGSALWLVALVVFLALSAL